LATGTAPTADVAPAAARVTVHGEFIRVLNTRPDWLFGMLCSWGLGLGTWLFLWLFTDPRLTDPMTTLVVPVVLAAVADGSLTNQLCSEPRWAGEQLTTGADVRRILFVRNIMLVVCELLFVALVVALTARVGHSTAWILKSLPELAVLPLASIAIGNVASVLVPCPFMRLNHRLQAVGTWARWAIYVGIPFALSSLAGALWTLPTYLQNRWEPQVVSRAMKIIHSPSDQHLDQAWFAIWLVLIPLWHLAVWLLSLKFAQSLAHARRNGLIRLIERHDGLVRTLPDLSLREAARQFPARVREIPDDLRHELKLIRSELLEATTTLSRL
jgi:hypothetical protein